MHNAASQTQSTQAPPRDSAPLRWGVDTAGGPIPLHLHPKGSEMLQRFGFDFVVHHYNPKRELKANEDYIARLDAWHGECGRDWLANLESANWAAAHVDEAGRDWYNRPDGRHFFLFPEELLEKLGRCRRLLGLMYDEAEHMQNCRNRMAGIDRPFIYDAAGRRFEDAAEEFTAAAAELAKLHAARGLKLFSEHVFPVLIHCFARAGFQPVPKILKEAWAPLHIACALGAALQYGTELWLTPDLWGEMWKGRRYPGHSPEEYRSALLLAYHMGANCIYTENFSFDHKQDGVGSLVFASERDFRVTRHGAVAERFRFEYMPAHPRDCSFRQLKPRVAVIRQPDSCWGQASSWLKDELFGNSAWQSSAQTEAWLRLLHLLTRGAIPAFAASWHADAHSVRPHQLFCPMDGVAVFDHLVGRELLKDAEAIFLAGCGISPQTLEAVEHCVVHGATCIGLLELMPERVRKAAACGNALADGKGAWVPLRDFLDPAARKHIIPFLPAENFIRYRFGSREVVFRPDGGDNDRLNVEIRECR